MTDELQLKMKIAQKMLPIHYSNSIGLKGCFGA